MGPSERGFPNVKVGSKHNNKFFASETSFTLTYYDSLYVSFVLSKEIENPLLICKLTIFNGGLCHHTPLPHLPPYLPPKISHKHCFSISLGTAVIPRKNEKQRLCKILEGK